MAFKWLTQHNSPNYTPASRVQATWGQPRTVKAIAIHWWGDPNNNPSFNGIVGYLCRPGGNSSAHIVATGTGRQAACIVNLSDASWATNSANPYTISIECDPRCRSEDYDVVAEVIAQLRAIYGNLPLVPHKKFSATACPGNYSLSRLDKIAKTKSVSKSDPWGKVSNKATAPASKPVPYATKLSKPLKFKAKLDPTKVWDLTTNPNYKAATTLKKGSGFEAYAKIDFNGSTYYVTKYSFDKKLRVGVNSKDLVPAPVVTTVEETETKSVSFTKVAKEDKTLPKGETRVSVAGVDGVRTIVYTVTLTNGKETKRVVKSDKITKQPVQEVTLVGSYEKPSEGSFTESDRNVLNSIKSALDELIRLFKSIFK